MIKRGVTLFGRAAAFLTILLAMTACGGGGGDGSNFLGTGGNSISITLLDPNGEETTKVTSSQLGTFHVKVSGSDNENLVVTGSTTGGQLVSDTALTDASGVARFQVEAGADRGAATFTASVDIDGTALTESLGFDLGESGLRLGYFDDTGTFIERQISVLPNATLAATGSAELSVAIVDADGTPVNTPEQVNFSSGCVSGGQASFSPESPVTSVNGVATIQYNPNGCSGSDSITASLLGDIAEAFATLTIGTPQVNAISFYVPTDPDNPDQLLTLGPIVLKGTGGGNRSETEEVQFRVVDGNGQPLNGVRVEFALSTEVGGLSVAPTAAFSDRDGIVTTTVASGDVATSVRVIATVSDGNGGEIATASDRIAVTTGLPDQNSISLSVGNIDDLADEHGTTFIVEDGFRVDGVTRTITVRMADKFNNPVVDGTTAVFTTEYGAIDPSCQTGVSNGERLAAVNDAIPAIGECSVLWTSQEPRIPTLSGFEFLRTIYDEDYDCPSHNGLWGPCPDWLGYTGGGRSTIMVHAIGEESFIDRNGNGRMDQDETDLVDNLPEAFIDHNEDGVYTPELPECLDDPMGTPQCIAGREEIFIDFDNDNVYDFNDDPAVYNGLLCPLEGDGVWCSRDLVNVRAQTLVILSDNPNFEILLERRGRVIDQQFDVLREGQQYNVYTADTFNHPPAGESVIKYEASNNCAIAGGSEFTVPNLTSNHAYTTLLAVSLPIPGYSPSNGDSKPIDGSVTISLEDRAGDIVTSRVFYCEEAINCDVTASPLPEACQ